MRIKIVLINIVQFFSGVADNEYEIESILFDDTYGSKTMYLVKWKNYPMDQCTWEPYRNLTNCAQALNDYRSNKIVATEIYQTARYKELYDSLNIFADQELLELLHHVIQDGMPSVDDKFVRGTIAYLSTVSPSSRSSSLTKLIRHNLMIIEVDKKRQKQQEKLNKWQNDMAAVCGFSISVLNNVDFEGPPKRFYYVDECVPGKGVVIPNDPPVWYVK